MKGILKEPNLAKEAGLGLIGALSAYAHGNLGGVALFAFDLVQKKIKGSRAREKSMRTKTSPADVVMFSGSKDSQTS